MSISLLPKTPQIAYFAETALNYNRGSKSQ